MIPFDPSRATWRKSSHSGANGSCIEVACHAPGAVVVRDSKNAAGPRLSFTAGQWTAFTGSLKERTPGRRRDGLSRGLSQTTASGASRRASG
jgi:Domain of unknown function (DUF397)